MRSLDITKIWKGNKDFTLNQQFYFPLSLGVCVCVFSFYRSFNAYSVWWRKNPVRLIMIDAFIVYAYRSRCWHAISSITIPMRYSFPVSHCMSKATTYFLWWCCRCSWCCCCRRVDANNIRPVRQCTEHFQFTHLYSIVKFNCWWCSSDKLNSFIELQLDLGIWTLIR